MKNVSICGVITVLLLGITSCTTTQSYQPVRDRSADVEQRYQEQSADDLLKEADDLFSAAVGYYKSGHFKMALERFIESQQLFERIEHLRPRVRGRLNSIKAYLSRLTNAHGNTVLRFAEQQLDRGSRYLSVEMLNSAEALLEMLKEWNPDLRDEANALIRRIQQARQSVIQKKRDIT